MLSMSIYLNCSYIEPSIYLKHYIVIEIAALSWPPYVADFKEPLGPRRRGRYRPRHRRRVGSRLPKGPLNPPVADNGLGIPSYAGLAIVQTIDFELNPIQFNSTQSVNSNELSNSIRTTELN